MEFRASLEDMVEEHERVSDNIKEPKPCTILWYLKKEFPSKYKAISEYVRNVERTRRDFQRNVPWKDIFLLTVNQMGPWLYGYTQLQARWAVIRGDLPDNKYFNTRHHELTHKESEYNTRVITDFALDEIEMLPYDEQNVARFMYGNRKHMDN